ncbi:rubredoxin-like domain-containing protein [Streptomyces sp. NPDC017964]|uniref:rubredoxin-like domain-containing protein n=1 Tax=Streptomyces sp. NPDC017964 TaxID=3365022 RepID=UPI0037BB0242
MTREVITVTEDTDDEQVRHLPVERRIRRVSVLAGQRLASIVSRSDVIAPLTTEWACQVCGQTARGPHPPPRCPTCNAGQDRFAQQEPPPGS